MGYQEGEEFKFIIVSLEKPLSVSAPMHQLKALVPLRLPEENSVTRNGLPSYEMLARDAPDIPQTFIKRLFSLWLVAFQISTLKP